MKDKILLDKLHLENGDLVFYWGNNPEKLCFSEPKYSKSVMIFHMRDGENVEHMPLERLKEFVRHAIDFIKETEGEQSTNSGG